MWLGTPVLGREMTSRLIVFLAIDQETLRLEVPCRRKQVLDIP
jgi:hypothetical protein